MRFAIAATVFAFAASVLAQTPGFDVISKPTKDEVVPAGATYAIEWAPNSNWTGTVTLSLLGGASQGLLQDLGPFAKGVDSAAGKYDWAVDKTLGKEKVYGLTIILDSNKEIFQYSHPFAIKPSVGDSNAVSSSSAAAPSESSAAASPSKTPTPSVTAPVEASTLEPTPSTTAPAGTGSSASAPIRPTSSMTTSTTASASASGTPTPTAVPANNAAGMGASSIALFGGLVMALFAF